MKIGIVTSFNEKLYNYYAHRFLKTYDWPFDLYIYHEGWTPEDFPIRSNVYYKNLYEIRNYQNTFNVRFQDLIENFQNTVGELFKFLDLSYSAQDLVNIQDKILNKHILPNKNAYRKGQVHSWRLEMSPYDISHFRDNLDREIDNFNIFWK